MTPEEYLLLAAGALVAATVSGVAGVGGGMLYLPLLIEVVGARMAVPYLTLLLVSGNFSRAWLSRKEIDWPLLRHFTLGAVPGAVLGALLYTALPPDWIRRAVGLFLLTYVALNFLKLSQPKSVKLKTMISVGGASGFVSGIVGGSGYVMAPFFLSYGLVKGGFLGTQALAAASTHIAKLAVWGPAALITLKDVLLLVPLALLMVLGSYFGKLLINRMRARAFRFILIVILAVVGFRFLFL